VPIELIPLAGLLLKIGELSKDTAIGQDLRKWVSKYADFRIMLLGSSGVGKSAVRERLKKSTVVPETYQRTTAVIYDTIRANKHPYLLIDAPGEKTDSQRLAELQIMQKKPYGIFNVVSYGYHEFNIDSDWMLTDRPRLLDFLQTRRNLELDALREWAPGVCFAGSKCKFVLTIMNKADQWWDFRSEVETHYAGEDYSGVVSEKGFKAHQMVPYSAIGRSFYGKINDSRTYGEPLMNKHRDELAKTLVSLLD
jgi:hypothetical protein